MELLPFALQQRLLTQAVDIAIVREQFNELQIEDSYRANPDPYSSDPAYLYTYAAFGLYFDFGGINTALYSSYILRMKLVSVDVPSIFKIKYTAEDQEASLSLVDFVAQVALCSFEYSLTDADLAAGIDIDYDFDVTNGIPPSGFFTPVEKTVSLYGVPNNTTNTVKYVLWTNPRLILVESADARFADVTYTLDEVTSTVTGLVTAHFGIVDYTLDELETTSTGTTYYQGQVTYTLNPVIPNVTGNLLLFGETDFTLDEIEPDINSVFGDISFGQVLFTLDNIESNVTGIISLSGSVLGSVIFILDELQTIATMRFTSRRQRRLFLASGTTFSKDGLIL